MGKEQILRILNSHYGGAGLLKYFESDDGILFEVPAPLEDPQTARFRTQAAALNDLAIGHRLSVLLARGHCGVPQDHAFAIDSLETAASEGDGSSGYEISLRFEVTARRYNAVTALRSTLVTRQGSEARTTLMSFNVLPPSLASFVRRERKFQDFADVKMGREESVLARVAGDRFRYHPSEADRLSDGRRVDHVPALNLVDIALWVDGLARPAAAAHPGISAEFVSYTDPRLSIYIQLKRDEGAVEFVQNDQLVAVVRGSQSCRT